MKGDFYCSKCGILNFASRDKCFKCFKMKDPDLEQDKEELQNEFKEGDWYCNSCNEHNYASRIKCRKCDRSKEMELDKTDRRNN